MRSLKGQFPQILPREIYADWTGAALPPAFLIDVHCQYLKCTSLGNPHSLHELSARATAEIMETRAAVLAYFNASPDEYGVVFTPNATGAIGVLRHFDFMGGHFLATADNHNSVNGVREVARYSGASTQYVPLNEDLTVNEKSLRRMLAAKLTGPRLFAYPAKSNFTGIQHNLGWVSLAQANGWSVLLDAASYCSNQRLDLSVVKPDFLPISFYKMFGFPTGVGCLLIRKEAYPRLEKKWFAGGSIRFVGVGNDFFVHESGSAKFEDGTVDFGMIPAVKAGLGFMESLGDAKGHAVSLATALYDELSTMGYNGSSIVIHSPRGTDIVAFSVRRRGEFLDSSTFERLANEQGLYVRSGCFCNPGVGEQIFGYDPDEYKRLYRKGGLSHEEIMQLMGQPGAIRASFGYANGMADVRRFVKITRDVLGNL
ncbi:MAG: aminotransferase class V-fold PLP-dependent enzyme [Candidatus Buchananbacteria bacterium]